MDFLNKIDRQKLQKIALIVISALTLLALVLLLVIIILSSNGSSPSGDIDRPSTNNKDLEFKTETISADQLSKGSLVLVNMDHQYIIPTDLNLVQIYEYREEHRGGEENAYNLTLSTHKLESNAMAHAHDMLMDLGKSTGNHKIMISSAFRDYNEQSNYSIPAGHSDSHTGLIMALTVSGGISSYLYDESNSDLNNWLNSNCYKYGFIVRYPADKTEITGVEDYTYAFRYVGIPHAQYMYENNLCLEEYIEYLKTETDHKKPLEISAPDGHKYSVYYVDCSNGNYEIKTPESIPNPDGSMKYSYTVSGTNEGGVIVTVTLS